MTTFERYFIKDKKLIMKRKIHIINLEIDEEMCNMIFEEFGLNS